MATINLLPWRDEYRQEQQREFFSVLVLLAVLAGLLAYVWVAFVETQLSDQRSRNALFQNEITQLEQQVKEINKLKLQRKQLASKIDVIQGLQNKRPLIVHYFDEMAKSVPDGIYFKSLIRNKEGYSIKGISESNNRVSTLMRNLDRSNYFSSPNLKNVVKDAFELTVELDEPSGIQR
ncbi:MAG: type IV pilus assembly protein PilN [Kiritimatiellia bacterium]|jgi:type IV pilus assembly protein PilN